MVCFRIRSAIDSRPQKIAPMKYLFSHKPFVAALSLLSSFSLSAETIQNGGFESWTSGDPDDWVEESALQASEVTGLDGTGSAALLGVSASSTFSMLTQTFDGLDAISGAMTFQFNFQLLSTGTSSGNGDRTLNVLLRDGDSIAINLRLDLTGNLQAYDGSASEWQSISDIGGTQNELIPNSSSDVYSLNLTGNIIGAGSSYDLMVYNLTDDSTAASVSNISNFQTVVPSELTEVNFSRGHSASDYIIDNVSMIPEPSSFALLGGICVLGMAALRRRRS